MLDALFFIYRFIFEDNSRWEEHILLKMIVAVGIVAVLASAQAACAADRVFGDERPSMALAGLGLGGMLKTITYVPTTSDRYDAFKTELDQALGALHEHGVAIVLEIAPGEAPQPLGRMRPYLDSNGVMQGGGGDHSWLPDWDDDFAAFVAAIAREHGRPYGSVAGMALGELRVDPPRRAELDRRLAEAIAGTEVVVRRIEWRSIDVVGDLPGQLAIDRVTDAVEIVRVYRAEGGVDLQRAMATAERFIGARDFSQLLFDRGVPWVFAFAGIEDDVEDGTLVVVGDLDAVAPGRTFLRGIDFVDARMRIAAGPYGLYDAQGNMVPAVAGELIVPLDRRGFFLRGDGSKGSFAALVTAVRGAQIEGVEPLNVVARDMTGPVGQWSVLKLEVGNVLNRAIEGALTVELGGLVVEAPARLRLGPHEQRVVDVRIVGGEVVAANLYPLRLEFAAGADGRALHEEIMRVNWIGRQSVKIDGKLGDWVGVLPQPLGAGVQGWLAYDDDYFYFAAKVRDRIEDPGTLRFAHRDDDGFFYPRVSYELDLAQALYKVDRINGRSSNPAHLWRPDGEGRIDGRWQNAAQTQAFAIDLTIPEGKPRQVAIYIPPGDFDAVGMDLELYDRKRQEPLDRQRLSDLGQGVYAVYRLAGKVRITLRVHDWHYRARLGGIFFDAADQASGFVGFDRETSGEWFGRYGAEGFYVVGAERVDPPDVSLRVPKVLKKEKRKWPKGVRNFSYRREPVLPSGDAPAFDNIQIAFNALAEDGDALGLGAYACTDYEFALNKVAKGYGGGTEVWRLLAPGLPRGDFYPRTVADLSQGPVVGAMLEIEHKNKTRISEVAIPWEEIPAVRALMEKGKPLKFSFRVNYSRAAARELAKGRSASRLNEPAFHAVGRVHWANELEFGWERE